MISLFFDSLIAFVFCLSAFTKIKNMPNFIVDITSYQIINYNLARYAAQIVVFIELIISVLFVFEWLSMYREILLVLLLVFFIVITINKRKKSEQSLCNCFGELRFLNKYPISRNIVLMTLALINIIFPDSPRPLLTSLLILSSIITLLSAYELYNISIKAKELKNHDI